MTEIAKVSATLVGAEIQKMKDITFEMGCNPILASDASNEEKIAILQSKVAQYEYTGCGLTMQDNIDIVSGWDCTEQDTVVAEEIRKLAESSLQSALNTKTLIEASIKEVEVGNQITERTAEALKKVVEILAEVRQDTEVSARLSEEQAQAMRGIESEINMITDVVQSNSATAQESSAVCEELTAQAISLNELVDEFSI